MLRRAESGFFFGKPADRRRVKKNLRSREGGEARGFGIPLIPANADADFPERRFPRAEPEVARRKVKFFLEARILRNVHFPIFSEIRSVRVDDRRRVVIDFVSARLEHRRDDDDAEAFSHAAEFPRRRSRGNRFSEVEAGGIFVDAEIFCRKHFLQADELCAFRGGFLDARERFAQVFFGRFRGGELDKPDGNFSVFHGRRRLIFSGRSGG